MCKNKRIIKRILTILVLTLSIYAFTNVEVSAGYMYDSDSKIINCDDGYQVTTDGIYGILSSSWSGITTDADGKINNSIFNSPADLCLYTDPNTGKETIYIVDSGTNYLFVFDGSLKYKETVYKFEIVPDDEKIGWTEEELSAINTASSAASISFWSESNQNLLTSVKSIPYGERTESQKFYIKCLGLSGVYRSLRPLKDDNGKIQLDDDGNTIYQDIIYLCDTTNKQVLLVDAETYKVIQVVSAPKGVDFTEKFQPTKIVTDSTGRMYIISVNIYEGILLMSYQGEFMKMVGVNYTTLSVWDAFIRNFKTEEQLAQETTILQTSFNNLCVDEKGFLYTVSGAVTNADGTTDYDAMIKRINQANTDVLKRNGYSKPKGDLIIQKTGTTAGGSTFVAITVNEYGVYTVADSKNNRLFTYDKEGNLLYISGGSGVQETDISTPVAIVYQGEDILLLDKGNKVVMRYEPTTFANKINEAVYYEFIGDSTSAADKWQEVINANPQYELAYVGVGKKLYEEQRYQEAMLYFEKGADVKYFSRAYKQYRDAIIKKYFPGVMVGILVLAGAGITWKIVKKVKNKKTNPEEGELL